MTFKKFLFKNSNTLLTGTYTDDVGRRKRRPQTRGGKGKWAVITVYSAATAAPGLSFLFSYSCAAVTAAASSAATTVVAVTTAAVAATDVTTVAVVMTTAAECSKKEKGADDSSFFIFTFPKSGRDFHFPFSIFRIF